MLAFMIFSFFFLTSDFVRQSAFARTGMRFTWHLHYQLGTLYFMLLHFQLGNLTFFCIFSSLTSLCVLCFSHFILQPSQELQVQRLEAVAIRRDEVKTTMNSAINLRAFKIDKNGFNTLISFDNEHFNSSKQCNTYFCSVSTNITHHVAPVYSTFPLKILGKLVVNIPAQHIDISILGSSFWDSLDTH